MNYGYEYDYLDLMQDIINNGEKRKDRTGTGTISLFGPQIEFDISDSFPLITTKKVYVRGIIHELLWFLSGNTNIKYLVDNNVHIWDEWADGNGDLGPVYGHQWRNFGYRSPEGYALGTEWISNDEVKGVDQIKLVIDQIRNNPESRRIIVSAWNPCDIPDMALPPCHTMFQFYVRNNEYLDCKMYQRSADYFLGVPFNIASYALLTYMIAHVTGLKPGKYIHTFGDAHLYLNHIEQAELQLSRSPRQFPHLHINKETDNIEDIKFEDINISNYIPHPAIKAEISV